MDAAQIQQVRSFNRLVTQRAGVLEDSYLRRGRPIGEARLLYEIGQHGAEVRDLRQKLALDSGYVSRLLRSLERQGLAQMQTGVDDGRVRRATLTPAGHAERKAYDRLSDALARSVLSPLTPTQQGRLGAAMAEVERLLRVAAVDIRREDPNSADARNCIQSYYKELAQRFEAGFDPDIAPVTPQDLTPPAGYLLVAHLDGQPIGCGALIMEATVAEIKRVWVAKSARGLGVARRLMAALEDTARNLGATTVQLDTNKALTEAQALYRGIGYQEVDAFNENPYAHHWFRKQL
jgi:DNA-binding MarR family transcriptional regulator/predicted GNAT family N-acyltransferase